MNKIRHAATLCLVIVIILTFTSCSTGGPLWLKNFFRSDREIANDYFEKIIIAIQNQDADVLKSLFSKKSIVGSSNFEKSMNMLFEFYKGEMISYNDWGALNASSGKNDDGTGRNWKTLKSTYDVKTSEDTYRFAIETSLVDSADADNIGVLSMYVIRAEDSDMEFAYSGDGKWIPGINVIVGSN